MYLVLGILLIFVVGVWWGKRLSGRSEILPERGVPRSASRSYAELVRICRGDREQADRLVGFELSRSPGISHREAVARALASYRRDNR